MTQTTLPRLLDWFLEVVPASKTSELSEDTELLDSRLLDSVQIIELVAHIEREFQVSVDVGEVVPENFCTIRAIVSLIDRLSCNESP